MGTKDITEQYLEAYNDVFADIANVLLSHGNRVITPDQLTNDTTRSVYKADNQLHEEERGIQQGQFLLADTIKRLNHGETPEQIIAGGVDENTVELAVTLRKEM